MKDPRDPKKNLKYRFPIPPPDKIVAPRKSYTKRIRRPSYREIVIEEDIIDPRLNSIPKEKKEDMPYITHREREPYDPHIKKLCEKLSDSEWEPGHINYIFSSIITYMWKKGCGPSYRTINEIDGILGGVDKEFYRRHAGPYEDKKIKENGDLEI
jgi:hypothetical protein